MSDPPEAILGRCWRRDSHVHGEEHWRAVADTAADLARATPGADVSVAAAFGWLHDSRRLSDGRDPEHGGRAEAFARDLHAEGLLDLDDRQLETLAEALRLHADGLVADDPTIGCCWDADRLQLPRVGMRVNQELLSTEAGRAVR